MSLGRFLVLCQLGIATSLGALTAFAQQAGPGTASGAADSVRQSRELLRSLDKARFIGFWRVPDVGAIEITYEIQGAKLVRTERLLNINHEQALELGHMKEVGQTRETGRGVWNTRSNDFDFIDYDDTAAGPAGWRFFKRVSPDGQILEQCVEQPGKAVECREAGKRE